jgi:hypothetical protein
LYLDRLVSGRRKRRLETPVDLWPEAVVER